MCYWLTLQHSTLPVLTLALTRESRHQLMRPHTQALDSCITVNNVNADRLWWHFSTTITVYFLHHWGSCGSVINKEQLMWWNVIRSLKESHFSHLRVYGLIGSCEPVMLSLWEGKVLLGVLERLSQFCNPCHFHTFRSDTENKICEKQHSLHSISLQKSNSTTLENTICMYYFYNTFVSFHSFLIHFIRKEKKRWIFFINTVFQQACNELL